MSENTGTAQIGVTGLAVMGRNLARNLARHGYTVALHNRSPERTRSLVAEHGDEGTIGLVLNRPTDTPVGEALPELSPIAGEQEPVYVGGPVAMGSVLAVAELDDPDDASELLFGAVGFVQEPDIPVVRGRVFVGYAGWSAGQLEAELEEESWLVMPAEADDLFSDDPDGLWSAVLRRQGGPYALLSLMPPDPSLN
jgi:putative transcriptional regulator